MPTHSPEPEPGLATEVACPACGHPFVWPPRGRCERCTVDLTSPAAAEVFELDRRWAALASERLEQVRRLEATRPQAPPPPPAPPAPQSRGGAPAAGGRTGVPALLGLAGVALLTAAAVVFTAVAWTTLPPAAKAVILLGATAAAAIGSLRLHLRGTTTAAAALGVLTMALAAVDVTGAHRVGLVDLGDLAVPLGLLAAAGVGWLLARADVGWVATLGVASAAAGLLGCGIVVSDLMGLAAPGATLVGSAGAALLGATAPTWPAPTARRLAWLLVGVGLALSGLVSVVALGAGDASVGASLGAIGATIAVAAAATTAHRWALAPASLLATTAVVAAGSAYGAEGPGLAAVAAAVAVAVAWSASVAAPRWRSPVLVGAAPVLVAASGATLTAAGTTLERLATVVGGEPTRAPALEPLAAAAVLFTAVALSAWPKARRLAVPLAAVVLVVLSGALPVTAAWMVLAAVATATVTADRLLDLDEAGLAALGCAVVAVGWAASAPWSLAISSAVVVAVAAHVVAHRVGWRPLVAVPFGTASAGTAVAAAADAVGLPWWIALGAGLSALLGAVALVQWTWTRLFLPAAATALLATGLVPALADEAPQRGLLLLVAAVGWLVVAAAGSWVSRWVASASASLGTALLLADRGVEVVEAYTVVPALTLGIVGVLWLRRDPEVRTYTALWPALSVAVAPSLLVLVADPQVVTRAVALALVAGALAAIGVRLRWRAPVVAGSATAAVVAATQLAVVAGAVPRWLTFAVVGGVLVWLAATYERQQARARAVGARLAGLR